MAGIQRVWVGDVRGFTRASSYTRHGGTGMPIGFALAAGFAAVFVGTAAAAVITRHDQALRTALVAVFVAVGAALSATVAGAVCSAGTGWLFTNGFLVNGLGDLAWRGVADLIRLAVFAAAALAGLTAGRVWQHRRAAATRAWEEPPTPGHDMEMSDAKLIIWLPPGQRGRVPRVFRQAGPNGIERRRNG